MLGQEVNLELQDSRESLVLLAGWAPPVQWARLVCRENEAEQDQPAPWVNVEHPATSVNQVLWVRWESQVYQDSPETLE